MSFRISELAREPRGPRERREDGSGEYWGQGLGAGEKALQLLADVPWPPQLTETLSRLTSLTATSLGRTKSEVLLLR